VGLVNFQEDSPWRTEENRSVLDEAAKRGYKVVFRNAIDENQEKSFIEELAGMNLEALFVSPKVLTVAPAIKTAAATGTPVVLLDRRVDETVAVPGVDYKTLIGFDMVEQGTLAAQYIVARAPAKLGAVPYKILEIEGTLGSSPQVDRKKGFEDELALHAGFSIVQDSPGDFNAATAEAIVTQALNDNVPFNVIFAHNDGMALGALAALKARFNGTIPASYMVVGIDGFKGATVAVLNQEMDATVTCSPSLGPLAFQTLDKILSGETLPVLIKVENLTCDRAAVMQAAANTADAYEFCDGFGTDN